MVTTISRNGRSRTMFFDLVGYRLRNTSSCGLTRAIITIRGDNNYNFPRRLGFHCKVLSTNFGSICVGEFGSITSVTFCSPFVKFGGRVNTGGNVFAQGAMTRGYVYCGVECGVPQTRCFYRVVAGTFPPRDHTTWDYQGRSHSTGALCVVLWTTNIRGAPTTWGFVLSFPVTETLGDTLPVFVGLVTLFSFREKRGGLVGLPI